MDNSFEQNKDSTEKIEMVEVKRISTVFPDQKILTSIADKLLQRGLISGYEITSSVSGYAHGGSQINDEAQYRLEILCDDSQKIEEIKNIISQEIGKKWDIPKITEDEIRINKELLGFIRNVETEHKKFLNQRRLTRAVALATLLSIGGIISTLTKKYIDNQRQSAIAAERAESYKKLIELERIIQNRVLEIEDKEREGAPLTKIPAVEFGVDTFEETREILKITRDAEFEMKKLLESTEQN